MPRASVILGCVELIAPAKRFQLLGGGALHVADGNTTVVVKNMP